MDLYATQALAPATSHQPPATSPASGMVLIEVNSDSGSNSGMGLPVPRPI
jgi:hypothetical protein